MQQRIRLAEETDIGGILAIMKEYQEIANNHENFPIEDELLIDSLHYMIPKNNEYLVLVVDSCGVKGLLLASLGMFYWSSKIIASDRIFYIDKAYRGLSVPMIRMYEDWARIVGATEITLSTASGLDTEKVLGFYRINGYKKEVYQLRKEL